MYHGYGTQDYMLVLRRGWGPWAIGRGASRYRYEYNVTMHLKMQTYMYLLVRRYCCSYSLTQLHLLALWRSPGAEKRKAIGEKIVETV